MVDRKDTFFLGDEFIIDGIGPTVQFKDLIQGNNRRDDPHYTGDAEDDPSDIDPL